MLFITLAKFRRKPTEGIIAELGRLIEETEKEGIKFTNCVYTLGRYDLVVMTEVHDEKAFMKAALKFGDLVSTETLVAVPAEEIERHIK